MFKNPFPNLLYAHKCYVIRGSARPPFQYANAINGEANLHVVRAESYPVCTLSLPPVLARPI